MGTRIIFYYYRYVESLLPPKAKKLDAFTTSVSYEFGAEKGLIARLFNEIEEQKYQNGIDDWGLSETRYVEW